MIMKILNWWTPEAAFDDVVYMETHDVIRQFIQSISMH